MSHPAELPYHSSEDYRFAVDQVMQAHEELRLYPTTLEFRTFISKVLRAMYEDTPCMLSMLEYAKQARHVVAMTEDGKEEPLNFDFYMGTFVGVHINVQPAHEYIQQYVLSVDYMDADASSSVDHEGTIPQVKGFFETWFSGKKKGGFSSFLESQPEELQQVVSDLAMRYSGEDPEFLERQLDFVGGVLFSCNVVWLAMQKAAQDNQKDI